MTPFTHAPNVAQTIAAFNEKYPNRVCLPMADDQYLKLGKPFLDEAKIQHARVPVKGLVSDTESSMKPVGVVYYWFLTPMDMMQFLNQLNAAGAL